MVLAELTMPFPWGLCYLDDPESCSDVPPLESRDQSVSAARTAVAIAVQHEVDGEASVRLRAGPFAGKGHLVFDGEIESDSGELRLGDVLATRSVIAHVGMGTHQVCVIVDDVAHPRSVDIVLGSLGGS